MPKPGSKDYEDQRHRTRRDMEEKGVRDADAADVADRFTAEGGEERVPGMPIEDEGREGQGS